MAIDYDDFIQDASSEKIVLAHIEPAQRLLVWSRITVANPIFEKSVDFYVIDIEEEGVSLAKQSSAALTGPGQWYFDKLQKKVFLRTTGDVDPTDVFLVATYRLFFSNAPIKLSHDLTTTGDTVEYEPLIDGTSQYGSFLENDAQIGVALEGDGNIKLINNDGFFEPYYDKLFWENKNVRIYNTGREVPVDQAKIIYEGFVQSKQYHPLRVTFQIRDFITSLRDGVSLNVLSTADGSIPDDLIGAPKRRVYGKVKGNRILSVEQTLDGFPVTGNLILSQGTTTVTGTLGTIFLDELSPGDTIFFIDEFDEEIEFTIKEVTSDTAAVLSENPERGFNRADFKCKPKRPYRRQNRKFLIAGHPLREPTTTVTNVEQLNRIDVVDVTDIEAGDFVTVDVAGNLITREVKRVSGLQIVLKQNLTGFPDVGNTVFKPPIQRADYVVQRDERVISRKLFNERDFAVDNSGVNPTLELVDLAEFNVTIPTALTGDVTFTQSSRTVTGSLTSFKSEIQTRDWINAELTAEWYEVLEVKSDTELIIRTEFSTPSQTSDALVRNVDIIDDNTVVVVDVVGKTIDNTKTGQLIKTGSQVVKDLLIEAGLESRLDLDRFEESNQTANFLISLKVPLEPQGAIPTRREVIDLVNQSIFGSLHKTEDFKIAYDVLAADKKPSVAVTIEDDDVIDYKVSTKSQNIVRKTVLNYQFADASTTSVEPIRLTLTRESEIARLLIKTERIQERDVYLFNTFDAGILLERWAFFNEISQSVVTFRAKQNFSNLEIGSVVFFKLDRLYTRFGTKEDENKIGIVSGITSDGINQIIEVDDLSGWFFTVGTITRNDADDFADADVEERAFNGYITDANELVDGLDFSYRINLIG